MSASAVTRIAIGMDVGSTTVKAVVVDTDTRAVLWHDYARHHTRQPETVLDFLDRYAEAATQDQIDGIGADIRREWERCKAHRQELTKARTEAMARIRK